MKARLLSSKKKGWGRGKDWLLITRVPIKKANDKTKEIKAQRPREVWLEPITYGMDGEERVFQKLI